MNADREELSRYRTALVSHPAVVAGGACPRPERIWEAARGGLKPREVAELVDHTLACSDCSLAWQLAVELGRAERQARCSLPFTVPRRRQIWGGVLAAAAAVLLAVTIPWQDVGERPPSGTRGGQLPGISGIRSLVPPDEPLSRQDCVLSWSSPWADATYSIKVVDEGFDKTLAQASGLTMPEFQVPAESLIALEPDTSLNWYVEATAPDGSSLGGQSFASPLE